MSHRLEYNQLLCAICNYYLGEFWSRQTGTVKKNLKMLKRIHEVGDEVLGLVEGITNLGPFPLRD